MVDEVALSAGVMAALGTVAGISTFDGHVPNNVPELDGKVLPYAVLWAALPDDHGETTADGKQNTDSAVFDFQVTVVASNAAACRAVGHAVQLALANLQLGTGVVRKNPDSFHRDPPLLDTSVAPARFMLPTFWRLHTN